jgi:hypothetical protein
MPWIVKHASHEILQEIATARLSLRGVNFIEVCLAINNRALGTIYDSQPMNVRFDRLESGWKDPVRHLTAAEILY